MSENARDRAFVMALYGSGCRLGARLIVDGKTGMRRVLVVGATAPLATWLSLHPQRDDPNAPLWIGFGSRNKGKQLNYASIVRMLQRLAARRGLKKRVHPRLFRHSRATFLASHLTEAQLNEMHGWVQGSSQAANDVHLSGRNVDEALLGIYGLHSDERHSEATRLKTMSCSTCGCENAFDARFCQKCGPAARPAYRGLRRIGEDAVGREVDDAHAGPGDRSVSGEEGAPSWDSAWIRM